MARALLLTSTFSQVRRGAVTEGGEACLTAGDSGTRGAPVIDRGWTGGNNARVSQKLRVLTSSLLPRLWLPFCADGLLIDPIVVQLAERHAR